MSTPPPITGHPAADPDWLPGRIGPCRVVHRLGAGGMAAVYLAELAEDRPYADAGTRVAVKVMHPQPPHVAKRIAERFEREAELGAAVNHPGVVRTYEAGSVEIERQRVHYLILEYVDGHSLRDLIVRYGVVSEALLRDLTLKVAHSLAAVHAVGAIHRDVKPANILITSDHDAKLTDFGLARLIKRSGELTSLGEFVGSPLYAAPEQINGLEVGAPADLYALGVTLYEAATGVQPFRADDLHTTMWRHVEMVPTRPRALNPRLSPFFDALVARLLAKDPELRFTGGAGLARALEEGESGGWWRERDDLDGAQRANPAMRATAETFALVGRGSELDALRRYFRDARSEQGRLVVIEGEAGVGKTRLVGEFCRDADRDQTCVLYGASVPGVQVGAKSAIARALLEHFGRARLAARVAALMTSAPNLVPAVVAYLEGSGPPPGEAIPEDALHTGVCHLLRGLASERTVILVVEDLHFAGTESRSLLLSLARVAAGLPVLILATTRPPRERTGLSKRELYDFENLASCRRVSLERLAPRAALELVKGAARQPLTEDLAKAIASKSDGNPLFVLALCRELAERPVNGPVDAARVVVVPPSVRSLIETRLEHIEPEDRMLLEVGAVQGHDFDADLIARVLGRRRLDVLQALARIEQRHVLVRALGKGFEFDHHLLQEVLYAALPPILRAEYHALLAETFAEREGHDARDPTSVPGDAAAFLVAHQLRGGKFGSAVRLLERAMAHLERRHHWDDLLGLCSLALATPDLVDDGARLDLLLVQADCLEHLAQQEERRAAIDEANRIASSLGDSKQRFRAVFAHAQMCNHHSQYEAALASGEEAERVAEAIGAPELAVRAIMLQGRVRRQQGLYEHALRIDERALSTVRKLGIGALEIEALKGLGSTLGYLGRYESALAHLENAVRRMKDVQVAPQLEAVSLCNLGHLCLNVGRYAEARKHLAQSTSICQRIGVRRHEGINHGNLAAVAFAVGDYDRARHHANSQHRVATEIGDHYAEALALAALGSLELTEGRWEVAAERLTECLELCRRYGVRRLEAIVLGYQGELERCRGDANAAGRLQAALDMSRDLQVPEGIALAATSLGRLHFDAWRAAGSPSDGVAAGLAAFGEAATLVETSKLVFVGAVPAAYLAALGARDPGAVEVGERAPIDARAEAHVILHLAGAGDDGSHLSAARDLVEQFSAHLRGADLASFWRRNPIARGVLRCDA